MNSIIFFLVFAIVLVLIIIAEVVLNNKFVIVISWLIKIPSILFIYFCLFWYWGGDGKFNLTCVPIIFLIYELILGLVLFKSQEDRIKLILKNIMVFVIPLLTIVTTEGIAKLMKVDNHIAFLLKL